MWKKIEKSVALCIAAILVIVATVSGTLAYESYIEAEWQSTKNKNMKVQLVQQQRTFDAFGEATGLEPFENDKLLVPLVASAQYDGSNFDQYGMPKAEGYVDQIIRVKNSGSVHAYVRVILAVPAALDNANEAGDKVLHWNLGNRFMPDGDFSSTNAVNTAFEDVSWKNSGTALVDGILCNLYTFTYTKPLAGGKITDAAAITGFYLDEDVNIVDGRILLDGVDTGFHNDDVAIHVTAQAVQAYSFENAEAAFGGKDLPANPWSEEMN